PPTPPVVPVVALARPACSAPRQWPTQTAASGPPTHYGHRPTLAGRGPIHRPFAMRHRRDGWLPPWPKARRAAPPPLAAWPASPANRPIVGRRVGVPAANFAPVASAG